MQIKIPKSMLDIDGDKFTINFKWSDNMQNEGDIMEFYINGDVAPAGRFKFRYSCNGDKIHKENRFIKYVVVITVSSVVTISVLFILIKYKILKKR